MIGELLFKIALLCWWVDERVQHDPERIGFFEWLGNRFENRNLRPWIRKV